MAFREFKAIWDPHNRMNPGKVVDPFPILSNLRLGADYRPPQPETHFQYPEDDYNFSRAALRCVGVGKCRQLEGGTMCPSYMVTLDEKHTTRGRAHLLFEMLQGEVIRDGWKSEEVKEALDLCLACKGCKSECPVNVDLATYKAEFLSHYYEGRLRPRAGYAVGLIYWWARLASLAPRLVNTIAHTPGLGPLVKWMGGISPHRELPAFAPMTFRRKFEQRTPKHPHGPEVMLWPDTFNNFFNPNTAEAAVDVLEAAGFRVTIPQPMLCCGRPLYEYGMLDLAQRQLRQILDALAPQIEAGVPLVGLEPSCVATFRDELPNLFPRDEHAKRLRRQVFLLSEFLEDRAGEFEFPKLKRKALVHGHCHHKSVLGFNAEEKVLSKLGLDIEVLDSGCCGMAGGFGFEAANYDVSIACGERALLPAVREADAETLIIADGFSCRDQVRQTTNRWPLHLADVLQLALRENETGRDGGHPENAYRPDVESRRLSRTALLVGTALLAAGGLAAWRLLRPSEREAAMGEVSIRTPCRTGL